MALAKTKRPLPDKFYDMNKPSEEREMYKEVYEDYDQIMFDWNYNGPIIVNRYFNQYAKQLGIEKDAKILDAFAGTGLVGQKMYEDGYTNLNAFDGSVEMLGKAKSKNVYQNIVCHMLDAESPLPIANDTYDAIVMCNAIFSCDHILELMRVMKPGGLFVNAFNEQGRQHDSTRRKLLKLSGEWEEQGKWKKLTELVYEDLEWYKGHKPYVQVYQVL